MRRRLAATVLAALVLAPFAHAAGGPVFGLRAVGNPKLGYFVYPLGPGGVKRGAVIVSNTGTRAGTVKLFTADGTTGSTTGTVYLTDKRPAHAGAWISLGAKQVTLGPGGHRKVPFVVHVPKGADPGQWVGGIVAESKEQVQGPATKRKARVQINIRDLTIVAVQVNVPGRLRVVMAVGGVTTGGQRGFQQVIAHIANEGNALVKPSGTITILGRNGLEPLERLRFQMDTFLPQTAIEYPVLLKRALAPGTYTALVKLAVPASPGMPATSISASRPLAISKQDVQQVFTTAVPQAPPPPGATASSSGGGGSSATWKLVVAVAGGVLLVVVLTLLAMRRRQRSAAPEPQPGPAPAVATLLRGEPEPPRDPEPEPEPQPRADEPEPAGDDCDHLWDVAYHHAKLGEDGVWRFPHRCRTCGREILAADVADANLSAAAPR